jgi:hypothetical protein
LVESTATRALPGPLPSVKGSHLPLLQAPPRQSWPHAPQLPESEASWTHDVPQHVCEALHTVHPPLDVLDVEELVVDELDVLLPELVLALPPVATPLELVLPVLLPPPVAALPELLVVEPEELEALGLPPAPNVTSSTPRIVVQEAPVTPRAIAMETTRRPRAEGIVVEACRIRSCPPAKRPPARGEALPSAVRRRRRADLLAARPGAPPRRRGPRHR